jgi:membrane protein implicated in regulation of membrane protease activity
MVQEIIAFVILGIAVAYLIKKYFFKNQKSNKNCGSDDGCGCS